MSSERENARILTVYYTYLNGKDRRPLIRLQGKWLQDLGFHSGNKIAIEEHGGTLLIKAVYDEVTDKEQEKI
ncbi:SymE family type I addiction module toxin [Sporomusa silvacetica]|uniref:SymE family type I addiction module toxin n=1 Tax=Sporomusa silvacetica TaxID=55504 RepID=UPI00146B30FC|nr:SymE family type I addiction module toxin [Sporomusa silvacetica]